MALLLLVSQWLAKTAASDKVHLPALFIMRSKKQESCFFGRVSRERYFVVASVNEPGESQFESI